MQRGDVCVCSLRVEGLVCHDWAVGATFGKFGLGVGESGLCCVRQGVKRLILLSFGDLMKTSSFVAAVKYCNIRLYTFHKSCF